MKRRREAREEGQVRLARPRSERIGLSLLDLPPELLLLIAQHVLASPSAAIDLIALSKTCHACRCLALLPSLWKQLCRRQIEEAKESVEDVHEDVSFVEDSLRKAGRWALLYQRRSVSQAWREKGGNHARSSWRAKVLWQGSGSVLDAQMSHKFLLLACSDGTLQIAERSTSSARRNHWRTEKEAETWRGKYTFRKHSGAVTAVQWDSNHQVMLTGSLDKTLAYYNLQSGHAEVILHGSPIRCLALSASSSCSSSPSSSSFPISSSTMVVVGSDNGGIDYYDLRKDLRKVGYLDGHQGRVTCLQCDVRGCGNLVLSGGADGIVKLWDLRSSSASGRRDVLQFRGHTASICGASLHLEHAMVSAASTVGSATPELFLWDSRMGQNTARQSGISTTTPTSKSLVKRLQAEDMRAPLLSLWWDGFQLFTSGFDNLLRVWDTTSKWDCVGRIGPHLAPVVKVTSVSNALSSSDGLVVACVDGRIMRWYHRSSSVV